MVRFCEETTRQLDGNSMAEVLGGSAEETLKEHNRGKWVLSSVSSTAQSPQALKKQVWKSMSRIRKRHHRGTSHDWVRDRRGKKMIEIGEQKCVLEGSR